MKNELQEMMTMFSDGSGFGDPEARRNAELRLLVLLTQEQGKTGQTLNYLTFIIAIGTLLQAIFLGYQVWGK